MIGCVLSLKRTFLIDYFATNSVSVNQVSKPVLAVLVTIILSSHFDFKSIIMDNLAIKLANWDFSSVYDTVDPNVMVSRFNHILRVKLMK